MQQKHVPMTAEVAVKNRQVYKKILNIKSWESAQGSR